jgi:hypothetical protein
MPRRRRFKGYRITSFYVPVECEDVTTKAEELARVEGWSFSELLIRALTEYVGVHYPGNPQLILPSIIDPTYLKPLRLEARFLCEDLRRFIKGLEIKHGESVFRRDLRARAIQHMNKLAKMNLRLNDKTIDALIDLASKTLEATSDQQQSLERDGLK